MVNKDIVMQCNHCGNRTVFKVVGEYEKRVDVSEEIYEGLEEIKIWRLMQCLTCLEPTLEEMHKIIEDKSFYSPDHELLGGVEVLSGPHVRIRYPTTKFATTPQPAKEMPPEVAEDFNEARATFGISPRSSAALLRLALQKLCLHLGQSGKDLNKDIEALVKNGLPIKIQQSLDIVRVIGNNAVHPGKIDLRDDPETVLALFGIINFIIEEMITRPRDIEKIYNQLPEGARKQIEERDKVKSQTNNGHRSEVL